MLLAKNLVLIQIEKFSQLKVYQEYLKKPDDQAMYVGFNFNHYSHSAPTEEEAVRIAKENCMKRNGPSTCKLVSVNSKPADISREIDLQTTELDIKGSIEHDERFDSIPTWRSDYNSLSGHKAFATNKFNITGNAYGYIFKEDAANAALKSCELGLKINKNNPKYSDVLKPCHVVLVNY